MRVATLAEGDGAEALRPIGTAGRGLLRWGGGDQLRPAVPGGPSNRSCRAAGQPRRRSDSCVLTERKPPSLYPSRSHCRDGQINPWREEARENHTASEEKNENHSVPTPDPPHVPFLGLSDLGVIFRSRQLQVKGRPLCGTFFFFFFQIQLLACLGSFSK